MKCGLFIAVFLSFSIIIKAQVLVDRNNNDFIQKRTARLLEISDLMRHNEDSLWFVGKEYKFFDSRNIGTPFFYETMKLQGSVVFNCQSYSGLDLFYDLVTDELVLQHKLKNGDCFFVALNKYWVEEFSLFNGYETFRFLKDSDFDYLKNKLPQGFLEIVYDNDLKLLIKYSKELKFEPSRTEHDYRYVYKMNRYLVKGNKCYQVTKKTGLFLVFPKNRKQIKTFLHKSKINYKKASRSELISLIEYCEKFS